MKKLEKWVQDLAGALEEKKGLDVKIYKVAGNSIITDFILVSSVKNRVHAKALADEAVQKFGQAPKEILTDLYPKARVGGEAESGWVVVDGNSVIVHIIFEDLREHFRLDSLFEENSVIYHS